MRPMLVKLATVVLALIGCNTSSAAWAQDPRLEDRVRAAFLYNFARFTQWGTPHTDQQLGFCVAGDGELLETLRETIRGKNIHGHTLLAFDTNIIDIESQCDVLYVGAQAKPDLLDRVAKGTLLVGEGRGFVQNLGMVGFVLQQDRLRFVINPSHVESAGLKLSAELLSLAEIVSPLESSL